MELIDKLLVPNWTTKNMLEKKIIQKAAQEINANIKDIEKGPDSAVFSLSTGKTITSLGADYTVKLKDSKKGVVVELQGEPKIDLEEPKRLTDTGYKLLEKIQKLCAQK
ncbi:MAG: hypothetical protein KIH09_04475 [Candidatus Freyarchaeota archaeon]|nr:hypothetical protein [Candidatus Jordarchaeia archaeon]